MLLGLRSGSELWLLLPHIPALHGAFPGLAHRQTDRHRVPYFSGKCQEPHEEAEVKPAVSGGVGWVLNAEPGRLCVSF